MKRVIDAAAMELRLSQGADYLQKLYDRSGPAMRYQQRERTRVRRADMQEMNIKPVNRCSVLAQVVQ